MKHRPLHVWLTIILLATIGCSPSSLPAPTSPPATPVPPTATLPPPTAPPTETPIPPTATPVPTATPIPPTPTPRPADVTVCVSGCDFTTIQAAIDDAGTTNGTIIEVTDPIHTEAGITVTKAVTIRGQGSGNTIVQAHETAADAPAGVFFVVEGAAVTLNGMTIRHGNPSLPEEGGGGIMNYGALTVDQCVVRDNTANDGAGICNRGALTLTNSTVSWNYADGIAPPGYECGSGGGIKSIKGTLALINSTVSHNEAEGKGGGVHVSCDCTAVFINSTISTNKAVRSGGGIFVKGTLQMTHCTVANNRTSEKGGGVYIGPGGRLDFVNTIVAQNISGGNCAIGGEGGYKGIGEIGTNHNNLVSDKTCDPDYSGDPMLGLLADNGGDTQTLALLPGSPAIDAIPAVSCTLSTDQRGAPRPAPGSSPATPCDIGAFERQPDDAGLLARLAWAIPKTWWARGWP